MLKTHLNKLTLLACAALTACGEAESSPLPTPERLVLECSGIRETEEGQERQTSILRILLGNPYQRAMHAFRLDEKRWIVPCLTGYDECSLSTDERFIKEIGRLNGGLSMNIVINRTTGRITETLYPPSDLGIKPITSFDGTCKQIQEPAESATKF